MNTIYELYNSNFKREFFTPANGIPKDSQKHIITTIIFPCLVFEWRFIGPSATAGFSN